MMCPDYGAVDHVRSGVPLYHFRQRFEYRVEHPRRHPSPITPKHAVPLAIFIGKVPPLRPCPSNPHHAFEIQPVILRRAAAATLLRRQKCADNRPFLVQKPNTIAQRGLQKSELNQSERPLSTVVHETPSKHFFDLQVAANALGRGEICKPLELVAEVSC